MLYIVNLCCIWLSLLCVIIAGCPAVYYDYFSGPLLVLNNVGKIFMKIDSCWEHWDTTEQTFSGKLSKVVSVIK